MNNSFLANAKCLIGQVADTKNPSTRTFYIAILVYINVMFMGNEKNGIMNNSFLAEVKCPIGQVADTKIPSIKTFHILIYVYIHTDIDNEK
jgi:hypothetical protein